MRPAKVPRRVLFFATLIAAGSLAGPAFAQDISINLGQGNGGVTERAIQLIALLTVLSIAPSILIMMTSFTRIVVVLSLLRTALGTATAPPNSVIIALAMFLTAFVMGPVLQKSYDDGIKPLVANQINVEEALQRAAVPLRGFMQKNVREKDLKLFMDLSGEAPPATPPAVSDHRPRGRLGADVDGHDDAAAGGGVAAVQADLLRAGRRLVAGGGQLGAELRGIGWRTALLSAVWIKTDFVEEVSTSNFDLRRIDRLKRHLFARACRAWYIWRGLTNSAPRLKKHKNKELRGWLRLFSGRN